jgi:hypothetical protein
MAGLGPGAPVVHDHLRAIDAKYDSLIHQKIQTNGTFTVLGGNLPYPLSAWLSRCSPAVRRP